MFSLFEKGVTLAAKASFLVGAVAMVLMMLHIGGDVIARTLFSTPLPGTLEITAEWYMIAIVYMPLGLIQLRDSNIAVDLFTQGLSDKVQHWLRALTSVGALAFVYCWAVASYDLAEKKTKRGAFIDSGLMEIPTWPVYWACFVAVLLLGLATVVVLIRAVLDARAADDGEHPAHHDTPSGGV
ncbi:TRAP transporter small permease [Rhodovulum sp. DZ06]|uniref:TRAP transporter small permease n=1 Tax=Rhodovulum sp. DZ06 TaxID=3425126 RepID=UPI003D3397EB